MTSNYVYFNPNPRNNLVIDCTVRAIAFAEHSTWDFTYLGIAFKGFELKDMPVSNIVWAEYLKDLGYIKHVVPNTCPDCYTVKQFCIDNPNGTFILGTGSHVVAVKDGQYYDTWDSGDELPIYIWQKMKGD